MRRPQACGAVVKSACILTDQSGESIVKQNRKLIHGGLPVIRSASPLGGDIAQRRPDQLVAASSVGNCPRVLRILRGMALTLSMALVV